MKYIIDIQEPNIADSLLSFLETSGIAHKIEPLNEKRDISNIAAWLQLKEMQLGKHNFMEFLDDLEDSFDFEGLKDEPVVEYKPAIEKILIQKRLEENV